ncbi:MAG: radical SAM protein [Candidatus Omnitrophota bacterium]
MGISGFLYQNRISSSFKPIFDAMQFVPNYVKAYKEGKLQKRVEQLKKILSRCALCPRQCKVNRAEDKRGFCGAGKYLLVSSAFAHSGEESCLVGKHGSGAIFFSHCNLKCVFCQNYEISHIAEGSAVTKEQLASYMLRLQAIGCHNINLVTPTHFMPQILEGLSLAAEQGLNIPLVYNCGGYESGEAIDMLEGIVDIYMPDAKFSSADVSGELCGADDYFPNLKKVLKKMHQQVGDLEIDSEGIARRGLLVRHLVLPNGLAGTREIMEFISRQISPDTYINIMAQYRPCAEAYKFPRIDRYISQQEYVEAVEISRSFGLHRFDREG